MKIGFIRKDGVDRCFIHANDGEDTPSVRHSFDTLVRSHCYFNLRLRALASVSIQKLLPLPSLTSKRANDRRLSASNHSLILTSGGNVTLSLAVAHRKQNANGETATCSCDDRPKKEEERKKRRRCLVLDCGHVFRGQRTLVGSTRARAAFSQTKLVYRSHRDVATRDIQQNRLAARAKERERERKARGDERNREIDGEAREGGRKVERAETVRRDKRGKKWVNLCFAFAFSRGVRHRFAATWRLVFSLSLVALVIVVVVVILLIVKYSPTDVVRFVISRNARSRRFSRAASLRARAFWLSRSLGEDTDTGAGVSARFIVNRWIILVVDYTVIDD